MLRASKLLALCLIAFAAQAWAVSVPDWMRQAARTPVAGYKEDTNAVVLLDEETTTVGDNGEVHTVYRRVVKILRPAGREYGTVKVYYDDDTKLTYLKAWSIGADGQEYEVKEKDAVETALSESLVDSVRHKILRIPAAEAGAVIGFEYQQKRRSQLLQDAWVFQEAAPVKQVKYVLRLPKSWEYKTYWMNHEPLEAKPTGENTFEWQFTDVPPIEPESYMPAFAALEGRMILHFFGPGQASHTASWPQIGSWYSGLIKDRHQSDPEIKARVAQLTAGKTDSLAKIIALTEFVQKDIRYVAVEIGIGGFQPHFASDIFKNRFGDCKDKVTLLAAMLQEAGIPSYYVVVNTSRGVIRDDAPSSMTFNHVISAIALPPDAKPSSQVAILQHPKLGRLLIFDPTDEFTPVGQMPASLQDSRGLLVASDTGELIKLPSASPSVNRLSRVGLLELKPDGSLIGNVTEGYSGTMARDVRQQMLQEQLSDRSKALEHFLSRHLGQYKLTKATVASLTEPMLPLEIKYEFTAPSYAKNAGNLLLVRPRVVGAKAWAIMETKPRSNPVEFDTTSEETDQFEITLPPGYEVDELPDPLDLKYDFGEYKSMIERKGTKLVYTRVFSIRQVTLGQNKLEELKKFFRQIAADERNTAVLKKTAN